MSTLSREQASVVIAEIREDNGGISQEDREVTRPSVLRSLQNVRRKLASATKILVDNLYSKETRFIYELIQNAEDNSYSNAIRANEKPFLTFTVHSDRIVIDSNEDGFLENNVRAICSTGESTKAKSEGYIGEKGIGFKSVFRIARKVHIQSGPFSFSFENARGPEDDGLGMVTPMNEPFTEVPAKIRTRMTLTLLDTVEFERVRTDFQNVPDTLLLFLQKLQDLTIEIHSPGDATTSVKYSKQEHQQGSLHVANLGKFTHADAITPTSQQKFYMVKRDVKNLPHDAARVEKNGESINHAMTILAFPVDKDDVPIIEQQHVFAFLPLRRAGFSFLIQSDFVTQANREDVVHTPRNEAILAGVAMAFRDAVLQFCNHEKLRYQWMRYLPSASISDEFWGRLWDRISDTLRKTPILRSWSEKTLHFPPQLRSLPPEYCDTAGEPLLLDSSQEIYLSPKYLSDDFQILHRLGARLITWEEILDRLRADLERSGSKWKSANSDTDWRTRMCDLLSRAFKADTVPRTNASKELKKLALIPIEDGRWVSQEQLRIYFPDTNEVPIPTDLRLNLVRTAATTNASWRRFLYQLGVTECPPQTVIDAIKRRYSGNAKTTVTLGNSIAHLRYLYWNLPADRSIIDLGIWLFNHKIQPVPKEDHLYFGHSEGTDSLVELFKESKDCDNGVPGYSVHFLHTQYTDAVDKSASHNGMPWLSWLEAVAKVRRNPQLCAKDSTNLSGEFQYIIKYRSNRLLWILKQFWSIYEQEIERVEEGLRTSEVQVEGGYTVALNITYLPLPRLRRLVEEYHVPDFDFISISPQPRDEDFKEWAFLERLGVGIDDDIDFYVRAVAEISLAHEKEASCDPMTEKAIFQLYHHIQRRCNEDLEMVCRDFGSLSLLYVPAQEGVDAAWVSTKDCIWDGPKWLRSKQRLNIGVYHGLEALIKTIMKIPDVSSSDVLSDLSKMKEEKRGNADGAEVIYEYLWHEVQSPQTDEPQKELRESIRNAFEKSALVYVPYRDAWFAPSDCVWAEPRVDIPGKASIATAFSSKKTFFTRFLKVPEPTATMHILSLKSQAKSQPTASKIKETIKLIHNLGVTAADVSELVGTKLFPVKLPNGQNSFAPASSISGLSEFVIMDNVLHQKAFREKIAYLDFSIEEIRDTRTFLNACGLQGRFTSNLVEEVTDVEGGVRDDDMTKTLRSKASSLVRCATHYTTPNRRQDPNTLYRLFRRAAVFVSDGINQSLRIRLDGKTIDGERTKANFHLQESENGLAFYLPKDDADRVLCFEWHLPRRLKEFFKITDPSAESVLGGVLRQQSLAVIEKFLAHAGVALVTVDENADLEDGEHNEQQDYLPCEQQRVNCVDRVQAQRQTTPSRRIRDSSTTITPNQALSLLMSTSDQFRPTVSEEQDASYQEILNNIVAIARRRAIDDMSSDAGAQGSLISLLDKLSPDVIRQGIGDRSVDRDRRVGAAGELYVFEYLQSLGLAGFQMSNWCSVIRDYAAAHHDYREIKRWSRNGSVNIDGLADIEYKDVEGQLTEFFIKKGHLAEEVWSNEHPQYYFEVKATTSSNRQEPFFMSRAQYSHLQNMQIEEGKASPKIYVIIRIYSIGQGDATGFDVYVDPETKRQRGRLDFRADTWAVTPNWANPERPRHSEDTSSAQREASAETSLTTKESNGASSSSGVLSISSMPPSVTVLPDRTSRFVVGGKVVHVRLPRPSEPSPSSGSEVPTPPEQSEHSPVESEAGIRLQQALNNLESAMQRFTADSNSRSQSIASDKNNLLTPSKPTGSSGHLPTPKAGGLLETPKPSASSTSSTQQGIHFGQTTPLSGNSLLGQKPLPAGTSIFGQPTSPPGTGLFGAPPSTEKGLSDQSSNPTGASPFGQVPPSGTSIFGQKSPSGGSATFGSGRTTPASGVSTFGQASSSSGPSLFGQNSPSTGTSTFGQTAPSTGLFGQTSKTSAFGQTTPSFGTGFLVQPPPSSGTSLFGQASSSTGTSLFSQKTPSLFGQKTPSLFGQKTPSLFGQQTPSLFGQQTPSTGASTSGQITPPTGLFGQTSKTSAFGQTTPSFGTGLSEQPPPSSGTSVFGQVSSSTGTSLFGQKTPATGTNLFSQSAPPTSKSIFGQAPPPTSTSLFEKDPSSTGKSLFSQGSLSTGSSPFGPTATNTPSASQSTSDSGSSPFGRSPSVSPDKDTAQWNLDTVPSSFLAGNPPFYEERESYGWDKVMQRFHCVTFLNTYQKHSFEEIRLKDYSLTSLVR